MALANRAGELVPYPAAMRRIAKLSDLEPGWNGHDAAQVPLASQRAAIEFLNRVWNEFTTSVSEPTMVAPTSDGGVALEWIVKDGNREKSVEVVFLSRGNEYSVRNRETYQLEEDGENVDIRSLLLNVIKLHVAHHFILAK